MQLTRIRSTVSSCAVSGCAMLRGTVRLVATPGQVVYTVVLSVQDANDLM
jgi:hypothetical protein